METLNNSNKNTYSFIAVPTQLFILLDYRLKLVLTSLIQVSSALANSNGWFYYSKEDLKKLCGIKNDKTIIACLETFYRLNLLEVQARTFKNNVGSRTANYYKLNFKEFEKYNEYSVYECMNIPELQIAMLDYTQKDYKTTYTAASENNSSSEDSIPEPSEASNPINGEIPTNDGENASEGLKTSIPELEYDVEDCPLTEDEFDDIMRWNKTPVSERLKECSEPADELSFLDDDDNDDVKVAEAPAEEQVKFEDKSIETASVIPSDLFKAEKREVPQVNINEKSIQACKDLVERYKQMSFKNSNECAELCKQASLYITKKYNQGEIYLEDKDRLIRELVNTRFSKFSL